MFQIAFNLAEGMMPFNKFHVLVKCVRENNVHLISGKDDHRAAEEYVRYIADSIRERLALLLCYSNAFSILSDGSEARKTWMEKEPVYYCIALQHCNGGVDADSLKTSIDDIFQTNLQTSNEEKNAILEKKFERNLVSATAGGASVNSGKYNGVLTQMKGTRGWLVNIHCVAHRAELSLKDHLFEVDEFKKLDDTMVGLYYVFRKSGKLKRSVKQKAKALGVDAYVLPKVTGTRFVGHRLNAVKVLLHNWTVYSVTFKNEIDERKHSDPVRSKLIGYLKVLDDFQMRCSAVLSKKILSMCSHLQYQFEEGKILAFEIPEKIDFGIDNLQELIDEYNKGDEGDHLAGVIAPAEAKTFGFCVLRTDESGNEVMIQNLPKAGQLRKKFCNREFTEIEYGVLKNISSTKKKVKNIAIN